MVSLLDKLYEDTADITNVDQIIAKNFGQYARLICRQSEKFRKKVLNKMDFNQCRAFYSIEGDVGVIKNILRQRPEFKYEGEALASEGLGKAASHLWLRVGESKAIEQKMTSSHQYNNDDEGVGILGQVFVKEDEIIIQTLSKLKFGFAKKMVTKYFGPLLKLNREAVVDLAKQMGESIASEGSSVTQEEDLEDSVSKIPPEAEQKLMTDFYELK